MSVSAVQIGSLSTLRLDQGGGMPKWSATYFHTSDLSDKSDYLSCATHTLS